MFNFFSQHWAFEISRIEQHEITNQWEERKNRLDFDFHFFLLCCLHNISKSIFHVTEYCKQLLLQKILWFHIGYCCVDVIICNCYQIIMWKYQILCIINHVFSRNWHEGQSSCFEEMVWILPVSVLLVLCSLSVVSSISDTPSPIL